MLLIWIVNVSTTRMYLTASSTRRSPARLPVRSDRSLMTRCVHHGLGSNIRETRVQYHKTRCYRTPVVLNFAEIFLNFFFFSADWQYLTNCQQTSCAGLKTRSVVPCEKKKLNHFNRWYRVVSIWLTAPLPTLATHKRRNHAILHGGPRTRLYVSFAPLAGVTSRFLHHGSYTASGRSSFSIKLQRRVVSK